MSGDVNDDEDVLGTREAQACVAAALAGAREPAGRSSNGSYLRLTSAYAQEVDRTRCQNFPWTELRRVVKMAAESRTYEMQGMAAPGPQWWQGSPSPASPRAFCSYHGNRAKAASGGGQGPGRAGPSCTIVCRINRAHKSPAPNTGPTEAGWTWGGCSHCPSAETRAFSPWNRRTPVGDV